MTIPTIMEVLTATADVTGRTLAELRSGQRTQLLARDRQIAMAVARAVTGASYPEIGRMIGGRDHTTILHGCRRIDALARTDGDVCRLYDRVRDLAKSRAMSRRSVADERAEIAESIRAIEATVLALRERLEA